LPRSSMRHLLKSVSRELLILTSTSGSRYGLRMPDTQKA
jgi:hypothetical protein